VVAYDQPQLDSTPLQLHWKPSCDCDLLRKLSLVGDEEQSSLGDFVEDELAPSPVEAALRGNLAELMRKVLATLPPREEQILRMRFGIGLKTDCTLEEVGQVFAASRERIRQIEAKALRKLRQTRRSCKLEGFMECE
jgi:RNA polymerase primary sigma factor